LRKKFGKGGEEGGGARLRAGRDDSEAEHQFFFPSDDSNGILESSCWVIVSCLVFNTVFIS